jgi:hypothetical protein
MDEQEAGHDTTEEGDGRDDAEAAVMDESMPDEPVDEVPIADEQRAAIARLREALLATEPAIDPELVSGGSAAELEESFEAARALVARVREALRLELAAAIPGGSSTREAQRPATAFDKIRAGLGER